MGALRLVQGTQLNPDGKKDYINRLICLNQRTDIHV